MFNDEDHLVRWMRRREQLHAALFRHLPPGDASQLEYALAGRRAFSEDEVAQMWRQAAATQRVADHVNHVYVHVPFCKSICHFCNYRRLRPSHPDLLRAWLDRLRSSLETLAPALRGHTFHTIYVGGGTPSVLPAPMVEELVGLLDAHLRFVPNSGRYVEMDPAVVSKAKVDAFVRRGFTHFSFGVQTFNREVNLAHNRGPQDQVMVARRVDMLRDLGVAGISFDFLLGLAGTEPEQLLEDIESALRDQAPRWVDIFFLTPTDGYLARHFNGSHEAFWEHQRRFREVMPAGLEDLAKRYGYEVGGSPGHAFILSRRGASWGGRGLPAVFDQLAVRFQRSPPSSGVGRRLFDWFNRRHRLPAYVYTQEISGQDAPLNLLGLGMSARTRIFGQAVLTYHDPSDDPASSGSAHYVGATTSLSHECRGYLLRVLRNNQWIDEATVQRLFGGELAAVIPQAIGAWEALGRFETKKGKLRLRPDDRGGDQDALLYLFPDEMLEREIARVRNMDLSAAALSRLLAPMGLGSEVAAGWVLAELQDHGVVLSRAGQRVLARFAPRLDQGLGIDVVIEGEAEGCEEVLLAQLVANGADQLGLQPMDGELAVRGEPARTPR